jgi:hypothetical protein
MDTSSPLPENRNPREWSFLLLVIGSILLLVFFLIGISDQPLGIVSMLARFFAIVLGIISWFGKRGETEAVAAIVVFGH